MEDRPDQARLRAWGGRLTTFAFPLAALVAALLVFLTADATPGLVGGLLVALVPWALLAGDVRVGPWTMVLAGIGVPAAVVLRYDAPGAIFLAMLAVAWLAAEDRSSIAEATALLVAVAIPIVNTAVNPERHRDHGWVFFATGSLLSWFIGRILRRERHLVAALTDAQARLRDAAAAAERQRIARDVHDVVGHSLTVMLLNVIGARRVLDVDPAAAAEALDRAEAVGRDSLDSVRAVVGLLRASGDEGATLPPAPGAADIAALARTATDAGLSVDVRVEGDLDAVDPYAGLAAFRLVQEAISNVEHHAPKADVIVRITNDGERLAVSVENGLAVHAVPPAARDGTGLVSMRERITALGGTFSAGPAGDVWRVEGSIPLRRSDTGALG
ncbi:MAG TPA: histidine kinase [Acidimicrobiales bacterium]|nr:histidine kinase [Acidimicrobiales bacterium]